MGFGMKQKDLDKLLKNGKMSMETDSLNVDDIQLANKKKSISKTAAQKQLKKAEEKLSSLSKSDEFYFNEDCTKCILRFNDVTLVSNNASLRLGAKQMKDYKSLWIDRVKDLVTDSILEKWKPSLKDNKILIEFCYDVNWDFMDYDGRIASFKAPLDGLEKSGLLIDDSWRNVSMILGKQRKSKIPCLTIMMSIEKDEDRYFSDDFNSYLDNS